MCTWLILDYFKGRGTKGKRKADAYLMHNPKHRSEGTGGRRV